MPYATVEELGSFLAPDPAPGNAVRLLERASLDVDSALVCAVYDVDADEMPTAPPVIKALREATLEQVAWRLSQGDDDGLPSVHDSVSIGSVSLSRGSGGSGGGSVGQLGAQAWQILVSARLTGHGPRVC